MKTTRFLTLASLCVAATLKAGPRNSSSYSIATDGMDAGGGRGTGGSGCVNDASFGGITGISTVAAPAESARAGYIGQLYEATALTVTAPGSVIVETGSLPLTATLWLDDATRLVMDSGIGWSTVSGPVGVSPGGIATAPVVYEDTPAIVQGSWYGLTGILPLTVRDTNHDNYGIYSADGIADSWQVQYFGIRNPAGGPALDPDGDGQDNLFEYNACLVPTDPLSFLSIRILDTPGGGHSVTFSPHFEDCSDYSLLGSSDLSLWSPVQGTITDSGTVRTVVDAAGAAPRRFYKLDVQRK